jgi:hypothetical protein
MKEAIEKRRSLWVPIASRAPTNIWFDRQCVREVSIDTFTSLESETILKVHD